MAEFSSTVTGLNGGQTETELSVKLRQLVHAVADTGKRGTLTLKLTIDRNKRDPRLIEIMAEVRAVNPNGPPPSGAFFLHEDELIPIADTQRKLPGMEEPKTIESKAIDYNPGYSEDYGR